MGKVDRASLIVDVKRVNLIVKNKDESKKLPCLKLMIIDTGNAKIKVLDGNEDEVSDVVNGISSLVDTIKIFDPFYVNIDNVNGEAILHCTKPESFNPEVNDLQLVSNKLKNYIFKATTTGHVNYGEYRQIALDLIIDMIMLYFSSRQIAVSFTDEELRLYLIKNRNNIPLIRMINTWFEQLLLYVKTKAMVEKIEFSKCIDLHVTWDTCDSNRMPAFLTISRDGKMGDMLFIENPEYITKTRKEVSTWLGLNGYCLGNVNEIHYYRADMFCKNEPVPTSSSQPSLERIKYVFDTIKNTSEV